MRRMLRCKLHTRGLTRLMAVLFAVQIMVGGSCLLTAEAHEMSQSSVQTQEMHANCAKSSRGDDQQFAGQLSEHPNDHSGNCYHCDQPDQLSSSPVAFVAPVALLLPGDFGLIVAQSQSAEVTGLIAMQMPTGPPRSSSLLYTTSQRILI